MSTIPTTTTDNPYAQYAFPTTSATKSDSMGQADFLRLMTEQMKNQDPLNPLKGEAFLGQLAQFSTVQGIENMQSAMNAMASVMENDQSLRAAALVGHDALVETSSVRLESGSSVAGEVVATGSGPIQLEVLDASGQVVRRISVNATGSGSVPFSWDGNDADGNAVASGSYTFKAISGSGESSEALTINMAARIESVSIESTGLVLNLAGLGSVPLASVRRIG